MEAFPAGWLLDGFACVEEDDELSGRILGRIEREMDEAVRLERFSRGLERFRAAQRSLERFRTGGWCSEPL